MNKEDRKRISNIAMQVESLKDELGEIIEAEEEKYDNLPEGLQNGEPGEKIQEGLTSLQDAENSLDDALSSLSEVDDI